MSAFFRRTSSEFADPAEADASPLAVSGADAQVTAEKKRQMTTVALRVLGALVVTSSLGAAAYFYTEYRKVAEVRTPQAEIESIVTRLSAFFELPTDEAPTLATVTDRDKIAGQEFFARAENGDKVLIYQNAKKAILFRPSTGKIVNVAPLNVRESEPEAPAEVAGVETFSESEPEQVAKSEIPSEPARITLYNGTTKRGLTNDFEAEFLTDATAFEVVDKQNAARKDYAATVVVDLSGAQSVRATKIAEELGVFVESLPEGEAAPDTDILIILGSDRL